MTFKCGMELLQLINDFSKDDGYRSTQKSAVFQCTDNDLSKEEIKKTIPGLPDMLSWLEREL